MDVFFIITAMLCIFGAFLILWGLATLALVTFAWMTDADWRDVLNKMLSEW